MGTCDTTPQAARACSGRCKGGGCGEAVAPPVWVLAACEGMAALCSKQPDGHLIPVIGDEEVSSFANGIRERLARASECVEFSQLVLIGSANDLSWTQASLPASVSKQVVAEIEYPLIPAWFDAASDRRRLTQALEHVFQA